MRNIGTAIGLFMVLKRYGERVALAHPSFTFLEAGVITVGIVAVMSVVRLSQEFVATPGPDASGFQAPGSFCLQAGDTRGHDEPVLAELRALLASSDVVVLAQASMARVADQLEADEWRVPILTSPRLGLAASA